MVFERPGLILLPEKYAICRLPGGAELPNWIGAEGSLTAMVRTKDEVSIVCVEDSIPSTAMSAGGWRAFKVKGPLDFSLVGILSSISSPLADAGVSIFALSTFDTDYFLVREAQLHLAIETLSQAGFMVATDDRLFA